MSDDINMCSVSWVQDLRPGIYRCVLPKDELRQYGRAFFRCGEADPKCYAYEFIYNRVNPAMPCLVRGSIKINGQEYGEFLVDGNRAVMRLKPIPWHDAQVEYELAGCN